VESGSSSEATKSAAFPRETEDVPSFRVARIPVDPAIAIDNEELAQFDPERLVDAIELRSGCAIERPYERLLAFCHGEYAYYDAVPSADPNVIDPLDVLVTVAMNSRVDTALKVHRVHQGMAANCEPILATIPEHADLIDLDHWSGSVRELLHAAVQAQWVLIPVATKVLHRKRRSLIPMLDSVVLRHYLRAPEYKALLPGTESKAKAAAVAMEALRLFRHDLLQAQGEIEALQKQLALAGFQLTPIRLLELLVWTQIEPAGNYRTTR
jgi:hypothetical protein